MPEWDERWKLYSAIGLLLLPVGVYLAVTAAVPAFASPSASVPVALTRVDFQRGVFALLLLVGCIEQWRMANTARDRMSRRLAAIHGDLDAIALARLEVDPARAPDVANAPLALTWKRTGQSDNTAARQLRFVLLLALVPMSVLTPYLQIRLHAWSRLPISVLVIGLMLAVWKLWPALARRRARQGRIGVVATDEGLTWQRPNRPPVTIRWDEARLFEITDRSGNHPWTWAFILSGPQHRIEWFHYARPVRSIEPYDITREEMVRRLTALTDLVVARTRLSPRTFCLDLMQRDSPLYHTGTQARSHLWHILTGCLSGALAIIALLTLVLYGQVWWGWQYLAGSFALAALYAAVFALRGLWADAMARRQPPPMATFSLPHGSPIVQLPVGFAHAVPWRRRYGCLILGSVSLPNAVLFLTSFSQPTPPTANPAGLSVVGWTAILSSLTGFVCLWLVRVMDASTIIADESGLSSTLRHEHAQVPWKALDRISAYQMGAKVQFIASNAEGDVEIVWDVERGKPRRLPSNVHPVTAEELAAVVCQRSGKTLQLERA